MKRTNPWQRRIDLGTSIYFIVFGILDGYFGRDPGAYYLSLFAFYCISVIQSNKYAELEELKREERKRQCQK